MTHSKIKNNNKYYFFANPYKDQAFTKCPKCLSKTKIRKFPLVIHIDPSTIFYLNKVCRFCTKCDLIIAKKSEIETYMVNMAEQKNPDIIGNDYLIIGTLEQKLWKQSKKESLNPHQIIDNVMIFKDHWEFDPIPAWGKM